MLCLGQDRCLITECCPILCLSYLKQVLIGFQFVLKIRFSVVNTIIPISDVCFHLIYSFYVNLFWIRIMRIHLIFNLGKVWLVMEYVKSLVNCLSSTVL
jgi:hypothetical protein